MFWWFNVYSPHWPLSGGVTQDIHSTLLAKAGSAEIEQRVLKEVASYGRQIGVVSDLLLELAQLVPADRMTPRAAHALAQLADFTQRIEALKAGATSVPPTLDEARRLNAALVERYPELAAP